MVGSIWARPAACGLALLIFCSIAPVRAVAYAAGPYVDIAYEPPPLLGRAALVYDLDAGRALYAAQANTAMPIASTTKLMTALLVLEHGKLDGSTTVSYHAATIGESTMYLRQGEILSLRNLLYGLLLPSGNDAAIALAEAVGGSEANFVAMMNDRCRRLGCTNTRFTVPHGLDGFGNYGTAHDLMLVLRADLRFDTFKKIVGTRTYGVSGTYNNYAHYLINVNEPLWWYPGVVGGKPGNTAAAGFCSALYVARGGRHIVSVILGMSDRYTDVRDLLNYALGDFTWRSPAHVSPTLEAELYPRDDFSGDGPYRFLEGNDSPSKPWRYYIGTGYYLRPPFLGYALRHPSVGIPTSQATQDGSTVRQRFGRSILSYSLLAATFSLTRI